MNYRLDQALRQTPLSPARRLFAVQQVLERAKALHRPDLCARWRILLERELAPLRRRHPLLLGVPDRRAAEEDGQAYFLQTIASIIDHEPSPEAAYLLAPIHHQLERMRQFRTRHLPVQQPPLIYC